MQPLRKFFLSDRVMMIIILVNAITIYFQTDHRTWFWLQWVDLSCTLIFFIEMLVKHRVYGFRRYWSDGWNRMDGILVLLSLPSLAAPFVEAAGSNLSMLLILRLLRVLKFFRVMRFFPNFVKIATGFRLAMRQTWAVLAGFTVIVVILGLINCSLFGDRVPQYFGTPLDSIYTIFRMFTVEGWYEIPDAVADATTPGMVHVVRLFFCLLLIFGGIIGMSFINSIFVDAMAEDNNDDVKEQLKQLEAKIDRLLAEKQNNS